MGLIDGFDAPETAFCADCGNEIYTANYGGMHNGVYLCKKCAELSADDAANKSWYYDDRGDDEID